jgi:hypothetical protein
MGGAPPSLGRGHGHQVLGGVARVGRSENLDRLWVGGQIEELDQIARRVVHKAPPATPMIARRPDCYASAVKHRQHLVVGVAQIQSEVGRLRDGGTENQVHLCFTEAQPATRSIGLQPGWPYLRDPSQKHVERLDRREQLGLGNGYGHVLDSGGDQGDEILTKNSGAVPGKGPGPGEKPDPASSPPRWLAAVAAGLAAMLLADRALVLARFALRYTDPDQALLWFGARDLMAFHLREPFFYAQTYLSWGESLAAAPLSAAGAPFWASLPIAALALGTIPWWMLARTAWRRGRVVASLVVLAAPLAMTNQYGMIVSMARGFSPGLFLAGAAAAGALREPPTARRLYLVGLLASAAVALNQSSILLTAPVGAYLLLAHRRSPGLIFPLAAGASTGLAGYALATLFYRFHPAYNFHPPIHSSLSLGLLKQAATHPSRYLDHLGLEAFGGAAAPLLVLVLVLSALAWSGKAPQIAAAVALVAAIAICLATPKAAEGTGSIFFSYARVFLAYPLALAFLGLIWSMGRHDAYTPTNTRTLRTRWAFPAAVALVAGVLFVQKQAQFQSDVEHAIAVNSAFAIVPADPVPRVVAECRALEKMADLAHTGLVVWSHNASAPYACGALWYGHLSTLNPAYERRTWRLLEEDRSPRTRILLVEGPEDLCSHENGALSRCELIQASGPRVHRLEFDRRPVPALLRELGVTVRNYSPSS